ncbi:hypothetical protein [Flavobacterium sp. ACN6]|uniref:hypothetical protein n=1 Tax=Flavobacterium sp. ACN6 TaxID=1920426 RepID=UPI0011441164|nr:hypothetical protein [Flavobacterium sp. ACN6]
MALILINKDNGPILFLVYLLIAYWGVFLISTEGLEIDFERRKYRKLFSVYGMKIGRSWNHLPEIKYIALVETRVKQTFGVRGYSAGASTTITERTVKINLFDYNEKYLTLYFVNDRNEALKIAAKIKEALKIEILTNF